MSKHLLAIVVLASAAVAGPDSATSVAEQLAKAIYAQDTAGNLDEAIRIYRHVLASSPQRPHAAQAQYRLAQSLLQKGDLNGAAAEFQKLATFYPDYGDLIASMARRLQNRSPNTTIHLGKLELVQSGPTQIGRYEHRLTKIEIPVSDGWAVRGDTESSGGGEMVLLSDTVSGATGFVWLKPYDGEGKLDAELQNDLEEKPSLRSSDWKVRPQSVERRVVAGEQALSAVADYVDNHRKMIEYLVWVRCTRSRLLFSVRIRAEDFATNQSRFDRFIAAVKIP
jgi:tetratricopeptide (TPR) repeat protein